MQVDAGGPSFSSAVRSLKQRATQSACVLEILHRALVLLRRASRFERAQILSPAGLGVLLP